MSLCLAMALSLKELRKLRKKSTIESHTLLLFANGIGMFTNKILMTFLFTALFTAFLLIHSLVSKFVERIET